jgi:predicted permease
VASVAAGIAAGLAPALRASRFELYHSIRDAGGSGASPPRGPQVRRLRHALLIMESAFAILLVVGAGLLARSFSRLVRVDGGYTADRVLTARVQMHRDATPEQTSQFIETVLARLRSMPGVVSAGAGSMMPMTRMTAITTFTLPQSATGTKPSTARAVTYTITPGYAESLALRLREGRLFTERDHQSGPRPLLVNEEFVRQYISGAAVGQRIGSLYSSDRGLETEIVGVVGNVLKDGNDRSPEPEIYFLHSTGNRRIIGYVNLVLRTAGNPAAVADEVRGVVRQSERRAVIERIDPLTTLVSASVEQPRFGVTVLSAFAALALTLAAVGLYGVLSYGVSQRRKELGVRAALGADRSSLVGLVLREALSVTLVGAAVGLAASAALTRLIQSLLFGISPLDPPTYVSAPGVLLVIATIAGLVPALRAARTDPAEVLRE